MEILSSREKSIKAFRASEEIHEWVPATMTYKNKKYEIEIKLKEFILNIGNTQTNGHLKLNYLMKTLFTVLGDFLSKNL